MGYKNRETIGNKTGPAEEKVDLEKMEELTKPEVDAIVNGHEF